MAQDRTCITISGNLTVRSDWVARSAMESYAFMENRMHRRWNKWYSSEIPTRWSLFAPLSTNETWIKLLIKPSGRIESVETKWKFIRGYVVRLTCSYCFLLPINHRTMCKIAINSTSDFVIRRSSINKVMPLHVVKSTGGPSKKIRTRWSLFVSLSTNQIFF